MPTLEAQLNKAERDLASTPNTPTYHWYLKKRRADQYHGNEAQQRGLIERIGYLQNRILSKIRHRANETPQEILVPTVAEPQDTEHQ